MNKISLFSLMVLLGACTGDKVGVTPANKPEGYFTDKAINALSVATTDSERDGVLNELEDAIPEKRPNWALFWEQAAAQDITKDWQAPQVERFLGLHKLSCEAESFRAFAYYVLYRQQGLKFLSPPERFCDVSLGVDLSLRVLEKHFADFEAAGSPNSEQAQRLASNLTRFYLYEYSLNRAPNWQPVIKSLSGEQWARVLKSLDKSPDAKLMASLFDHHLNVNQEGVALRTQRFALLQNPEAFKTFSSKMGLPKLLEVLGDMSHEQAEEIDLAVLERNTKQLVDALLNVTSNEDKVESWSKFWLSWIAYRHFEAKVSDRLPLAFLAGNLERIQLRLEGEMRQDMRSARSFFDQVHFGGADFSFLKLRILGRKAYLEKARTRAIPEKSGLFSKVDTLIAKRMSVHLAENDPEKRTAIQAFCAYLNEQNIPTLQISGTDLRQELDKGLKAGCYRLSGDAGAKTQIDLNVGRMSFDAALIAPGQSLKVVANSFDGSMIDLSSEKTPATQVVVADRPQDRDALVVPMVLGLEGLTPEFKPKSMLEKEPMTRHHVVVMHLPVRLAKPGIAAPAAEAGESGGNLVVRLRPKHSAITELSFPPTFVSMGSAGQPGAVQSLGGREAISLIGEVRAKKWAKVADYQFNGAAEKFDFQAESLLETDKIGAIFAARKKPEVLVFKDYLAELNRDELVTFDRACAIDVNGKDAFQLRAEREKCLEDKLAPMARDLLALTTGGAKFGSRSLFNPAILNSRKEFLSPRAPDGPVNPSGADGRAGQIDMEIDGKKVE